MIRLVKENIRADPSEMVEENMFDKKEKIVTAGLNDGNTL